MGAVSGPILVPILDPKVVPDLGPLPIYVVRIGSKTGTTFGPKFGTTFGPLSAFALFFLFFACVSGAIRLRFLVAGLLALFSCCRSAEQGTLRLSSSAGTGFFRG